MSDPRPLVFAINKFLKSQLDQKLVCEEFEEGIEVCIQCLESAYNLGSSEPELDVPFDLQEIFQKCFEEDKEQKEREPTPEERAAAYGYKNEGNVHMDSHNFGEAIACYTKAINLDPKNPVYYCNRAAALNNINKHEGSVQDCKTALKLDPNYSKAYCRLGLAYSKMKRMQEAADSYKRAVELDPTNQIYKDNLKLVEDTLASSRSNRAFNFNFQDGNLQDLARMLGRAFSNSINNSNNDNNDLERIFREVFGQNPNPASMNR